jgi:hypothetical protein
VEDINVYNIHNYSKEELEQHLKDKAEKVREHRRSLERTNKLFDIISYKLDNLEYFLARSIIENNDNNGSVLIEVEEINESDFFSKSLDFCLDRNGISLTLDNNKVILDYSGTDSYKAYKHFRTDLTRFISKINDSIGSYIEVTSTMKPFIYAYLKSLGISDTITIEVIDG